MVNRSSLPVGASSRHSTSVGRTSSGGLARADAVSARRRAGGAGSTRGPWTRSRAGSRARASARAGSSPGRPGPRRRSAARPSCSSSTTCSAGLLPGGLGLVADVERVAVQRRVARQPAHARRLRDACRRSACRAGGRSPSGLVSSSTPKRS